MEPGLPPSPPQKLKLELSLKHGFASIELGQQIEVEAAIRNVSPDPQQVVLPGDGSDMGWREPHVLYIGEIDVGDGKPTPLPWADGGLGRCGNSDTEWRDEVVTIPPGGVQPLGHWIGAPSDELSMQRPGLVSLTLKYSYTAGGGAASFDPGAMGTTPAFVLLSNKLKFRLTEPLQLILRPRDPPPRPSKKRRKLAELYQLEVHNNSDIARELPGFSSADLRFPVQIWADRERYLFHGGLGSYDRYAALEVHPHGWPQGLLVDMDALNRDSADPGRTPAAP